MGVNVKALSYYNAYNGNGQLEDVDKRIKNNFEIINGDIRDNEFISKITSNVDVIFDVNLSSLNNFRLEKKVI